MQLRAFICWEETNVSEELAVILWLLEFTVYLHIGTNDVKTQEMLYFDDLRSTGLMDMAMPNLEQIAITINSCVHTNSPVQCRSQHAGGLHNEFKQAVCLKPTRHIY